jgi:hypothetical protein
MRFSSIPSNFVSAGCRIGRRTVKKTEVDGRILRPADGLTIWRRVSARWHVFEVFYFVTCDIGICLLVDISESMKLRAGRRKRSKGFGRNLDGVGGG